jgi:ABC-2 type transport system permease protein
MQTLKSTLSIYFTTVRKEIVQQWRTKRFLVAITVFMLFGLGSPMLAKLTPELIKNEPMGEELLKLLPPPSAADAISGYVEMIGLFGFFIAILLGMNAVAGEKESGTASLILSKPMPRWVFILSKFSAQSLVYSMAFLVGTLTTYYCIFVLFGAVEMSVLIKVNLLLLLWLLTFAGVALLASVLGQTVATAAGVGLGLSVLINLTRNIPHYGKWTPSGLMTWATELGANTENVAANPGAIIVALVMILICLIGSVVIFERQEIQ